MLLRVHRLFLSTPSARRATRVRPPASHRAYISIHALCEEGDLESEFYDVGVQNISIHALCEEGDPEICCNALQKVNFYPRPLRGGRQRPPPITCSCLLFLSTPSARRATFPDCRRVNGSTDFYPRPLRGGRLGFKANGQIGVMISIHALCEEGDPIPPPKGGGSGRFLSTPSARRATLPSLSYIPTSQISIHALCEEGDKPLPRALSWTMYFYPRPLRGGRPVFNNSVDTVLVISIHALCEEGDRPASTTVRQKPNFYPRPLRGGRPGKQKELADIFAFLSTPSARRATRYLKNKDTITEISIHALCEEGDDLHRLRAGAGEDFYPRPLRGGRPRPHNGERGQGAISIHALCEEGDTMPPVGRPCTRNFYPRPLRGGRQQKQRRNLYFQTNYTTFCTNLEEP